VNSKNIRTPAQLLSALSLDEYLPAFEKNAIDADSLTSLTDTDLEKLGILIMGHRKKILEAISQDVAVPAGEPTTGAVSPVPASPALMELAANAPLFVASPLAEALREPDPVLRLWAMCDSVEMLLRFLAVSLIAEKQSAGTLDPESVSRVDDLISAPTLGAWFEIVQVLKPSGPSLMPETRDLIKSSLKPLLYGSGGRKHATTESSFLSLRNHLAHGGLLRRKEGQRLLEIWQPRFESTMAAARWLQDLTLIGRSTVPTKSPSGFVLLRGCGAPVPFDPPRGMIFSGKGSLWLARDSRKIVLWPLAIFAEASLRQLGSARRSKAAHAQIYNRQEPAYLAYTPLGAEDFCESHGSHEEWGAFKEMFFADRGAARRKHFTVPGFEKDLRKDAALMVGRVEELNHALGTIQSGPGGIFWIAGVPGMGKSVLMARLFTELVEQGQGTRHVFAYRFRAGDTQRCSREAFALFLEERFIHAELLRQGLALEKNAKAKVRLKALFDALVADCDVTLLLDGMDEILRADPDFVDDMMPFHPAVKWVCAGRPESDLVRVMAKRNPVDLFPGGLPPMGESDIRGMFLNKMGPLRKQLLSKDREDENGQPVNDFISLVTRRAGGLPLYVTYAIGDVLNRTYRVLDGAEDLPESLSAYHEKLLTQLGIGDLQAILAPVVALLATACEPLDEEQIKDLLVQRRLLPADKSGSALLARGLEALASMLKTVREEASNRTGFVLFHTSLRDHVLGSEAMASTVKLTRASLADLAEAGSRPKSLDTYTVRYGIGHLLESGRRVTAEQKLLDLDFLAAMHEAGVDAFRAVQWWRVLGGETPERVNQYYEAVKSYCSKCKSGDDFRHLDYAIYVFDLARWNQTRSLCLPYILRHAQSVLQKDDPAVTHLKLSLAMLYNDKGEKQKNLAMIKDALETARPMVASLDMNFYQAMLPVLQGDYRQVRVQYFRDLLSALTDFNGREDPSTVSFRNGLGSLLQMTGQVSESRLLLEENLEICTRTLPPSHPTTLSCKLMLAHSEFINWKNTNPPALLEEVCDQKAKALGADHSETLDANALLAQWLLCLGDLQRAESLSQKIIESQARILGENHVQTLKASLCLGNALFTAGHTQRSCDALRPVFNGLLNHMKFPRRLRRKLFYKFNANKPSGHALVFVSCFAALRDHINDSMNLERNHPYRAVVCGNLVLSWMIFSPDEEMPSELRNAVALASAALLEKLGPTHYHYLRVRFIELVCRYQTEPDYELLKQAAATLDDFTSLVGDEDPAVKQCAELFSRIIEG